MSKTKIAIIVVVVIILIIAFRAYTLAKRVQLDTRFDIFDITKDGKLFFKFKVDIRNPTVIAVGLTQPLVTLTIPSQKEPFLVTDLKDKSSLNIPANSQELINIDLFFGSQDALFIFAKYLMENKSSKIDIIVRVITRVGLFGNFLKFVPVDVEKKLSFDKKQVIEKIKQNPIGRLVLNSIGLQGLNRSKPTYYIK